MKIPAMIAAELRRLTATRMAVIALIALMCVPILYGGLYLWANQDPYGKLADVPVGLVVEDTGVAASGDQPASNYGEQVADQLMSSGTFAWQRLTPAEAQASLAQGGVDFTVTIPADFSAALTSAAGTDPHAATISLQTNDANNYLASTIGSQAVAKIQASVTQLVGKQAALRLLTGISDIRSNLVTAADGATSLASGADAAASGANTAAAGAAQLSDGTSQLAAGAGTLSAGADRVASGAAQVASGTAQLAQTADQVGAVAKQAAGALPQVRSAIAQQLADQGLTQAQIDQVLAQLDPLGTQLTAANTQLQAAVGKIDQLNAGAQQVSSGASQVADGASNLASGADAAASGASQLKDGTAQLASGLTTLDQGAAKLRDGLESGLSQIPDSSAELREKQAETISDPVTVTSGKLASAEDYGAGLAPFFVALAGWIGIYALFLIVKPISRRAVTALHSPLRVTVAGWLTPGLLGGVQMLGLFGVLAVALGFTFANPVATLGIMLVASLTYAAIVLALNVWLGSVGQFLGLVLMVLQLVTAGGTFPWQTLPGPLAALHHVLPMGYVVDAMRQLMYGGDLSRVPGDLAVLFTWMIGALLLAAIGVTRMTHRRTLRDLQPSLIG